MKTLTLAATLSFVCPLSFGADACATPGTTAEVNACAQQKVKEQDALLNRTYQTLLEQLGTYDDANEADGAKKRLVAAQRKWIEFRDADCKAKERIYKNGSIHTVVFLDCIREHTEQRIKNLNPLFWQAG